MFKCRDQQQQQQQLLLTGCLCTPDQSGASSTETPHARSKTSEFLPEMMRTRTKSALSALELGIKRVGHFPPPTPPFSQCVPQHTHHRSLRNCGRITCEAPHLTTRRSAGRGSSRVSGIYLTVNATRTMKDEEEIEKIIIGPLAAAAESDSTQPPAFLRLKRFQIILQEL